MNWMDFVDNIVDFGCWIVVILALAWDVFKKRKNKKEKTKNR